MKRAELHRSVRVSLGAAGVLLAGIHLQMLWARLADGSFFDPIVAGRWLLSVALIALFAVCRRRGLSLFRGRVAAILWLLVVLLHGVGMAPTVHAAEIDATPAEIAIFATPLALGVAGLLWAGALWRLRSGRLPFALSPRRRNWIEVAPGLTRSRLAASGPRAPPG